MDRTIVSAGVLLASLLVAMPALAQELVWTSDRPDGQAPAGVKADFTLPGGEISVGFRYSRERFEGSLIGTFLNVVGVFMIFVTDLHHLMLIALADSYTVFVPGVAPPLGEMSRTAAEFVARSFLLGVQIAAPFIVVGLVFYIGLGLLARLMPQVQVFFIAIPLQIMLGFSVMAMTMSAGLYWFLTNFESGMIGFIGRG